MSVNMSNRNLSAHASISPKKFAPRTKKKYIWTIELEGKRHTIELYSSLLSGKKKVVIDGSTKLNEKR